MAGLFSGMSEESNFQKMAALAARESDPYAKLGIMLGTMLGGAMGSGMQSEKEIAQAWMLENGQNIDWNDPTSIKEAAAKAQPYSPELAANLIQESFSLSRELAKAAAAAKKDRDVTAMRESDVTNITAYLKGQGYDVDTDRDMALINEIHSQSQRRNQSYDEALASILAGGKYSPTTSGIIFKDIYLTKPQGKKPTAPATAPVDKQAQAAALYENKWQKGQ